MIRKCYFSYSIPDIDEGYANSTLLSPECSTLQRRALFDPVKERLMLVEMLGSGCERLTVVEAIGRYCLLGAEC